MRTMMTEKYLECGHCLVCFRITVEPDVISEKTIQKQYPASIKWLSDFNTCPVCGNELHVEER